jgi:hypothetical protein
MLSITMAAIPALGAPVVSSWPAPSNADAACVASAALGGLSAVASATNDTIEVRDAEQNLLRTVTRDQLAAASGYALDADADGPCGLALSDSGRLLFIAVTNVADTAPPTPSAILLRLDVDTGSLSQFAPLAAPSAPRPRIALTHFKGRLYVGTTGGVAVFNAGMNQAQSLTPLFTAPFVSGQATLGLAIDRVQGHLYACTATQISRATIGPTSLPFTSVGTRSNLRSLAFSDHYGGLLNTGLYALESTAAPQSTLWHIPLNQARGIAPFSPSSYLSSPDLRNDLAATADGKLMLGADAGANTMTDTADARLSFRAWARDEFDQVVRFGRGLISPDGQPAGWVIDADTQVGTPRFHPATPDAACWTILLLLAHDEVLRQNAGPGDPTALPTVRTILQRYAGQASDGIRPLRSADGIYWHWINPATGGDAGWGDGFATLSTMKIVLAATRAAAYYPGDAGVQSAAREIVCNVRNWDSYFGTSAAHPLYFLGLASGGAITSSASTPYNEGIIFADLAAAHGGPNASAAKTRWFDRGASPAAAIVTGRLVTGDSPGVFQSAFTSLYPMLTLGDYRADPLWQGQIANLRASNAAWTDDYGPQYSTVFSAGTTRSDWGGYHADSLTSHPGDVTTFPSLLAFAAGTGAPNSARVPEAIAAYNAYRRGARQTFSTGASILYRRSNVDRFYQPDSAGLPDVALGALGLAEMLSPGLVDRVLVSPAISCAPCVADTDDGRGTGTPDGGVTIDDLLFYLLIFESGDLRADVDDGSATGTRDGGLTIDDLLYFLVRFESGC